MKLKKKLFCSLATLGMVTAAATVVVACSKGNGGSQQHEEEGDDWDINIDFVGETKVCLASSKTYSSIKVSEFKLSTMLGADERMDVFSTTEGVSVVSYPRQPGEKFDVYVQIDSMPEDEHVVIPFDLKFKFSVNNIEKASKVVDGFAIDYSREETWEQNDIKWKVREDGSTPYSMNFTAPEGATSYLVRDFVLDHELQPYEDIQLGKTTVTEETYGVKMSGEIQRPVQGNTVSVLYTVSSLGSYGFDEPIHFKQAFKFTFKGLDQETVTLPSGTNYFTLQLREEYVPPEVLMHGFSEDTVIEWNTGGEDPTALTPGISGFYFNSFDHYDPAQAEASKYFTLNQPLSGDDEIRLFCNNSHIDASLVLGQDTDVTTGGQFVDINVKFNNLYDPFEEKTESFRLAFEYYFAGQPRGYQWLPQEFTLTYTPQIDPEPDVPDNYGITLDPIAIDTTGDGELTLNGKISKQGSTQEFTGLDDDDYLKIENESFGDWIEIEREYQPGQFEWIQFYNGYYFSDPGIDTTEENSPFIYDWYNHGSPMTKEQAIESGRLKMPITNKAIKGSDLSDPEHINVSFTMKYCPYPEYGAWRDLTWSADRPMLFASTIKTTFSETNPFPEDGVRKEPNWDDVVIETPVDLLYYPPNMWNGDAITSTEAWMQQRSLVVAYSYLEIPGDESSRKYYYTNAIFAGQSNQEDNYLIVPWEFANKVSRWKRPEQHQDWADYDELLIDPRIGIGISKSAHRYLPNDETKYLIPEAPPSIFGNSGKFDPDDHDGENTQRDYKGDILWCPIFYYLQSGSCTPEYQYRYVPTDVLDVPDLNKYVWNSKVQNSDLFGPDLAIISLNSSAIPGRDDYVKYNPRPGTRGYELVCDLQAYIQILSNWYDHGSEEHEKCYTNFLLNNANLNMDNWAYGFCSGFDSKEIEVEEGKKQKAYYWKDNIIPLDSFDNRPISKSLVDAKNQNFPDLGRVGDDNIKHASYAYQSAKSYNASSDEWFNDVEFSAGSMFVIRQWKDGKYGEELDLPRLAGVNTGRGIVDPNDSNKFFPWFDLFSNDSANLLEDYLVF